MNLVTDRAVFKAYGIQVYVSKKIVYFTAKQILNWRVPISANDQVELRFFSPTFPVHKYFLGEVLPPHLSPFVDTMRRIGDYVPPEEQKLGEEDEDEEQKEDDEEDSEGEEEEEEDSDEEEGDSDEDGEESEAEKAEEAKMKVSPGIRNFP